jgi:hypothetical protein
MDGIKGRMTNMDGGSVALSGHHRHSRSLDSNRYPPLLEPREFCVSFLFLGLCSSAHGRMSMPQGKNGCEKGIRQRRPCVQIRRAEGMLAMTSGKHRAFYPRHT